MVVVKESERYEYLSRVNWVLLPAKVGRQPNNMARERNNLGAYPLGDGCLAV